MIRVANIVEEGRLGGPQTRIVIVAKELAERLETIVILPKDNSGAFIEKLERFQIPYEAVKLTRISRGFRVMLRYLFFSPFEIFALAKFLQSNRFDLVHVSGGSWQYKGAIAAKMANKKVVWHVNDTDRPWIIRIIFRFLSRLADGFIFSANRAKDYYEPYVDKSKPNFVILPPVDTKSFSPESQHYQKEDEETIRCWEEKMIIGTVANINPYKGLDTIIWAASLSEELTNHVNFVILGSMFKNQKNYKLQLERLIQRLSVRNVEFLGGRKDVRKILQRFDIFVCASLSETGPMSLFEAMSMGIPIVSTDVGDVTKYIQHGYNGYIFEIGDFRSLKKYITNLISDSELRKCFGDRSRQIAINELDVRLCAQKHLEAYTSIIG